MKIPFLPFYILTSGQISGLQKKIKKGLVGAGSIAFLVGVGIGRLTAPDISDGEE